MAATFTEASADPITRARTCIPDAVVGGKEEFSDERIWSWLDNSLSLEALHLWMPDDNTPVNTTGTAEVKLSGSIPGKVDLELVLTTDVSGAKTYKLSYDQKVYRIHELVTDILDIGHGWKIGVDAGHVIHWVKESHVADGRDWTQDLPTLEDPSTESLSMLARTSVLALSGVGGTSGTVDGFGKYKRQAAVLRFYQYASVKLAALNDLTSRRTSRSIKSRREGNVTRTYEDALKLARSEVSDGIYAAC